MANGLTGDYDAVVEVGMATVNRLLASIHQKGTAADVSPKFPHSLTARVGEVPKNPHFQLAETFLQEYFGDDQFDVGGLPQGVLGTVQENVREVKSAIDKLVQSLPDVQVAEPPVLSGGSTELVTWWRQLPGIHGTARIQVGTPTISLPNGSSSEVTVHAQIRVHYLPDPGTVVLPAPIHGEVRAVFAVKYNASGSTGKPAVEVKPTEDISKIVFVPASGTPAIGSLSKAAQVAQITTQIRRFLRTKFDSMSAELPEGFPFRQFKGLTAGSKEAIAFPVMLSGQYIPALALNSVTDLFLESGDHFAVAIKPHYISTALQPALQPIEDFQYGYKVTALGVTLVHFSAGVSNATVNFEAGALVLTVTGGAKISGWVVSDNEYDFTIKQKFALELNTASQLISLQPIGSISISGLPQKWKDMAKSKIEDARNDAVAAAQPMIQKELNDRRATFNNALKRFDKAANAKYTAVEIHTTGVVLRGTIALSARPPAVADLAETPGGTGLTAFKSWIPGGNIDRFNWSWLKPSGEISQFPWEGLETQILTDPHRFTFALGGPGRPQSGQRVCLEIEGTQTGSLSEVSGGEICHVDPPWWLGAVAGVSSALAKLLLVPVWGPDPGPEVVLDRAIVAHMNLRTDIDMPADAGALGIVHFATDLAVRPLPALSEAVLASRHRNAAIPVIVVLPLGSLAQGRSSVEERLGALTGRLRGPLIITEDYQGGWTQAFNASKGSATYLMRAGGEHIWQSASPLLAASLTSRLDEQQTIGHSPESRPPGLRLRSGEFAPEVLFTLHDDPTLRRLRGQPVLLVFWKSWSSPCLSELGRLQRLDERGEGQGITTVAVGDGEDQGSVGEIRAKHGLSFPLVADPERRIGNAFRINCWPTTVLIDEGGRVLRVHLGVTSERLAATEHQSTRFDASAES